MAPVILADVFWVTFKVFKGPLPSAPLSLKGIRCTGDSLFPFYRWDREAKSLGWGLWAVESGCGSRKALGRHLIQFRFLGETCCVGAGSCWKWSGEGFGAGLTSSRGLGQLCDPSSRLRDFLATLCLSRVWPWPWSPLQHVPLRCWRRGLRERTYSLEAAVCVPPRCPSPPTSSFTGPPWPSTGRRCPGDTERRVVSEPRRDRPD